MSRRSAKRMMIALRPWPRELGQKRAGVSVEYRTPRSNPEIALAEIDRAWQPACASVVCWQATAPIRRFDKGSRHADWHGPLASLVTSRCIRSVCSSLGRLPKFEVGHGSATYEISYRSRQKCWPAPSGKQTVSWRSRTQGRLIARFAAVRVRTADGPPQRIWDKG